MRMNNVLRLGAVALVAIVTVGLASCSSSEPEDSSASSGAEGVCEEGREGGTFTYRTNPEGAGLDPVVSQANVAGPGAIYGTLIGWDEEAVDFEPLLAESLESNEDATVWTLKLDPDVTYSDGNPLDAEAVKRNLERYVDPAFPSAYTGRVAQITTMTVEDPQTLVMELQQPWGSFPWLFTRHPGMIINPAALDAVSPEDLAVSPPDYAGAGAFTLSEYTVGTSMTLSKKDDWWGGLVCLDEVVLSFGNDPVSDYEALEAGQVNAMQAYDPVARQRADEAGFESFVLPEALGSPMLPNSAQAPFNDVRMREALSLAMDRDLINERVVGGMALASGAIVPPGGGYELDVLDSGFDPEAAAALVEDAAADGVPVSFEYSVNRNPTNENLAILQQSLGAAVGLDIKNDFLQQGDWIQKVFGTRNFDVAQGGVSVHESCIYCAFDQYTSDGANNMISFKSDAFDAALVQLQAAAPGEETLDALNGLQEVWNEDVPFVIAMWLEQVLISDGSIAGLDFGTSAQLVYFDKAYLAQ